MEGVGTRKTEKGTVVGTRCAGTTSLVMGLAIASAAHGSFLDPFQYAGGEGTLRGLMENDAAGGVGVFGDAGFGTNMVNVFVADLSNATSGLSNAGVTLFVMWGNGDDPGSDYWASIAFTAMFETGEDGTFNAGVSSIYALGEGVSIFNGGTISIGPGGGGKGIGEVDPSRVTPRGFAITNLQAVDEGELMLAFSLYGSIEQVGLFSYGDTSPELIDGDLYIPLPLIVPLPPPLGLALAGLIGVVFLRRRMIS